MVVVGGYHWNWNSPPLTVMVVVWTVEVYLLACALSDASAYSLLGHYNLKCWFMDPIDSLLLTWWNGPLLWVAICICMSLTCQRTFPDGRNNRPVYSHFIVEFILQNEYWKCNSNGAAAPTNRRLKTLLTGIGWLVAIIPVEWLYRSVFTTHISSAILIDAQFGRASLRGDRPTSKFWPTTVCLCARFY